MFRMQQYHAKNDDSHCGGPAQSKLPPDPGPGEAVKDVEPDRQDRRDDVHPVSERTQLRILQPDILELEDVQSSQRQSADENDQAGREKEVANFDRTAV